MDLRSAKTRSKALITLGFSAILASILVLLGVWVINVSNSEKILKDIANAQLETRQISTLRNAALRRAITLHRMSIMDDPFDQEKEERRFRELGDTFLSVQEKILSHPKTGQEKLAWDHVRETLRKGGRAQNQVLEMILDGETEKANKLLLEEVVPTQDIFVKEMSDILDGQRESVEEKIAEVTHHNNTTYWLIALFGGIAFFLGIFTIHIIRRTNRTEDALLEQGKRVRELYKVSAMAGLGIDEQINEMLSLGCRLLKLEISKVCRTNTEKNTNTFLYIRAPKDYHLNVGKVLPLDKTFCSITNASNKVVALNNISTSGDIDSGYYEFSQLESYIAINISMHGKKYGTVNFSSRHPRKNNYSSTDKDLVKLIGSWIGLALERQQSQEELHMAKVNAETANQTKTAFLANMSHELRTPLNAILGYSELLIEEIKDTENDDITDDLKKISTSGHHLLTLINDVLDLSKVEAGKMDMVLQPTDVAALVVETIDSFRPSLLENHDKLVVDCDEHLGHALVDPTRLKQVLLNLFSNAIKFTENGTITVKAERTTRNNKPWVAIRIEDTGIGIAANDMEKLFQPFRQANADTAIKYGGTGLGLALSRRMCHMMGGDISVQSQKDRGSIFTIWLPLEQTEDAQILHEQENMPEQIS